MCNTHHNKIKQNNVGCNHQDHKKWNRRSFLQALGMVGGGAVTFANTALSVVKPSPLSVALNESETDRVLILIRLKGGNDGLNTIVPINQYDTYANARPSIRIKEDQLFNLDSNYGMPNYAQKLERMWGDGKMKVVHGVGYNDSSLSHFKGSDIWASSDVTRTQNNGWLGRYFENLYPDYLVNPPEKPVAIQIGSNGNLIFEGDDLNFAFSAADPKKLFDIAQNGTLYDFDNLPDCTYGEKVGFLKGVANTTFTYAGVINEAYEKSNDYGDYPDNNLSRQLSIISRLIKGNLGTKVYLVTIGSFDTHNDQPNRHQELISQLTETISYFYEDLGDAGWDDKVVAMTISEFGRRVKQNGSNGTDHGTAAPVMLFGKGLEGNGFIGEHPDLTQLTKNGDMTHSVDFRQLYASVMKEWLCIDENQVKQVLLGEEYESLDLGFSCSSSIENPITDNEQIFEHLVTYSENQSFLHITNTKSAHVDISLYNLTGQKVATLRNEVMIEGKHIINIKEASKTNLAEGFYAYRIVTNKKKYSKPVMIL